MNSHGYIVGSEIRWMAQKSQISTGVCLFFSCKGAVNLSTYVDFWGAVVSDYRQFAEDNPEKLAKAIENGIPDTLRGMMWQLM